MSASNLTIEKKEEKEKDPDVKITVSLCLVYTVVLVYSVPYGNVKNLFNFHSSQRTFQD